MANQGTRSRKNSSKRNLSAAHATGQTKKVALLSNHARVLCSLANPPTPALRVIAQELGITERAVQGIVRDLEIDGLIGRTREGRTNSYSINWEQGVDIGAGRQISVGTFLRQIVAVSSQEESAAPSAKNPPKSRLTVTIR